MKKETIPLCVIAITVLSLFFIVITTAGRPSRSDLVEHVHPSSIGYTKDVVLVRFKPEKLEVCKIGRRYQISLLLPTLK